MQNITVYTVIVIAFALLLPSCVQSPEPGFEGAQYLDGVGNCILENRDALIDQAVVSNDGITEMHDGMMETCGFDVNYLSPEARDWYEQQTTMSAAVIDKWEATGTFPEDVMASIRRREYFEMALMMQFAGNLSLAQNGPDETRREIALELLIERHTSAIELRTRRLIDPFAVMR